MLSRERDVARAELAALAEEQKDMEHALDRRPGWSASTARGRR